MHALTHTAGRSYLAWMVSAKLMRAICCNSLGWMLALIFTDACAGTGPGKGGKGIGAERVWGYLKAR